MGLNGVVRWPVSSRVKPVRFEGSLAESKSKVRRRPSFLFPMW